MATAVRPNWYNGVPITEDLDVVMPAAPVDGYDVLVVADGVIPDFSQATQLGIISSVSLPVAVPPAGSDVEVYLRARKNGYASVPVELTLRLRSDGAGLQARPNAPHILSCMVMPVGDVRLAWDHSDLGAGADASGFEIYGDGGSGQVDWTTAIETAGAASRHKIVSGLVPGIRHLLGIRALSAGGVTDGNWAVIEVVPRDAGPAFAADVSVRQVDL